MKIANWLQLGISACALPLGLGGCGTGLPDENTAASVKLWLSEETYKDWVCEAKEHEAVGESPHGINRVCSNSALSGTTPCDPYPQDAAAVKEIYDVMGGAVVGHAYYRKIQDDSATGQGWYYYEDYPAKMVAVAEKGAMGCASCHEHAGMDAAHGGHDFVYVQVKPKE